MSSSQYTCHIDIDNDNRVNTNGQARCTCIQSIIFAKCSTVEISNFRVARVWIENDELGLVRCQSRWTLKTIATTPSSSGDWNFDFGAFYFDCIIYVSHHINRVHFNQVENRTHPKCLFQNFNYSLEYHCVTHALNSFISWRRTQYSRLCMLVTSAGFCNSSPSFRLCIGENQWKKVQIEINLPMDILLAEL